MGEHTKQNNASRNLKSMCCPQTAEKVNGGDTEHSNHMLTFNLVNMKNVRWYVDMTFSQHVFAQQSNLPKLLTSNIPVDQLTKVVQIKFKPQRNRSRVCLRSDRTICSCFIPHQPKVTDYLLWFDACELSPYTQDSGVYQTTGTLFTKKHNISVEYKVNPSSVHCMSEHIIASIGGMLWVMDIVKRQYTDVWQALALHRENQSVLWKYGLTTTKMHL